MKVIDLTHTIAADMPVYPGTEPPVLTMANTYEKDGFKETLLHLYSHTGTHMDAPHHIFPDGTALDEFGASEFVGQGLVIDAADVPAGGRIDFSHVQKSREMADKAEFLIFRTGWEQYWGQAAYFGEFPVISEDVADYLLQTGKKGIGLDTISLDPLADDALTMHHKFLAPDRAVIIENLCNLALLGSDLFLFAALPLKFLRSDGAPVRAVGILP
jgi:kynurenine formamidase